MAPRVITSTGVAQQMATNTVPAMAVYRPFFEGGLVMSYVFYFFYFF